MESRARFASIVLACIDPMAEVHDTYFSFGVRRVQAALLASPRLAGRSVRLLEFEKHDVDAITEAIEALDPDVVGFSAFVWSFSTFVPVARRLKERRPDRVIVFGGPSARTAMFALDPWREAHRWIDVLVLGEGEETMERLVAEAPRTEQEFADIGGVAVATQDGWKTLGAPARVANLGALPSPYVLGLTPHGGSPTFESFRGCPLACSFCQWGEPSQTARAFTAEYLMAELLAIRDTRPKHTSLADAAINLNPRGFRNLAAAEREVRVLRDVPLLFEVYPLGLSDDHVRFLKEIQVGSAGIGLQSYDPEVLRRLGRPFDAARFERTVRQAADFGPVTIEFIFGLPSDGPDAFWRTFERARTLGANLRLYRCLILPDALLTRMPQGCTAEFDPDTLQVRHCTGWTEDDLARTAERLTALSTSAGGLIHQGYWWDIPAELPANRPPWYQKLVSFHEGATEDASPPAREALSIGEPSAPAVRVEEGAKPPSEPLETSEPSEHPATEALREVVARATAGAWQLVRLRVEDGTLHLDVENGGAPLLLSVARATPERKALCVVQNLAVWYRSGSSPPSQATLKALPVIVSRLRVPFSSLLGLETERRSLVVLPASPGRA